MFKKAFWVPYEDSTNYPTLAKTMDILSKDVQKMILSSIFC